MKKLIVAVANATQFDDERKQDVEALATRLGAKIQGVMQYPDGMPIMAPEVFIEGLKMSKAHYVVGVSPDLLLSELSHDSIISKSLAKEGISVYDLDFELPYPEIIKRMPEEIKNDLMMVVNQEEKPIHLNQRKTMLLVSGETSQMDILNYISELSNVKEFGSVTQLQVRLFDNETASEVKRMVAEDNIEEVIFYDEFTTKAYHQLIEELQQSEVNLTIRSDQETPSFCMVLH